MKHAVIVIGLLLLSGVVSADYWQLTDLNLGPDVYPGECVYDHSGNLHFIYNKYIDGKVYYGMRNTSGIYTQMISDSEVSGSGFSQICVDSVDEIHVAFLKGSDICYAKRYIDGTWSSVDIVYTYIDNDLLQWDITTDDADTPFIIIREDYSVGYPNRVHNVLITYPDSGSWDQDQIYYAISTVGKQIQPNILINTETGVMYAAYTNATGVDDLCPLMVSIGSIGSWTQYLIDTWSAGPSLSGMLDSDGHPHYIYGNSYSGGGNLKHTWYSGSNWESEIAGTDTTWSMGLSGDINSDNDVFRISSLGDEQYGPYIWEKESGGIWTLIYNEPSLQIGDQIDSSTGSNKYPTIFFVDQAFDELYLYDLIVTGPGCINVSGKVTYVNGTSVGAGETVAVYQNSEWYNTTTNATGGYTALMLEEDVEFTIFPVKTGYTSTPASYTLYDCGNYTHDLFLTEEDYESTAIGGIVYLKPYYEVEPGLNVSITNGTFTDYNLTTDTGFYIFYNLTDEEEYTLTASPPPKHTGQSLNVTKIAGSFTQQDFILNESFTLSVQCRNALSLNLITGDTVTISLSTGQSNTTTTGLVNFTGLRYNVFDIIATCDDYYSGSSTIILDDDTTVVVYLEPMSDLSGPASNYVPHPVRFTYVDAYGNPITGATVTAKAQEATNPWSWLSSVFGFNTNLTDINTTLSGTTGHDGTLSFLMVETVQYRVNCVKASAGINHTVDIYPKESEYFIRIGSLPLVGSYPTYSLNATNLGANVLLFGNYTDTSGSSSNVRFIVRNSTGSEVYNSSVTLTGGVGSAYYSVNNTMYDQYTYGLVAEHDTHGTIEKWIDITLKGTGRLIDFGDGWTDFMYLVMSVACIFLVAGCFGEIDVRMGAIFIPITSGIFWFIGWMSEYYGGLITIAGVLGAIYYMRSKAKELDT